MMCKNSRYIMDWNNSEAAYLSEDEPDSLSLEVSVQFKKIC